MESTFYRYYSDSDLIKVAGNTAYHYDENGNLLEKGNVWTESGDTVSITATGEYWKYEYDLLNRLTKVYQYNADSAAVELVVEYGYDVNNLRVYRKTAAGEITHFVFDLDDNRIEEHASTGSDYYVWRNGRHLARRTSGGTTYFYSTDHVGSTVLMTDVTGAVVWSGEATPFGDQVAEDGVLADAEDLKYQGKDYDSLAGLVYMNARWYSPELGRFMSEDPARDGVNWFAFVGNNPLTFVDPTGLFKGGLDFGYRLAEAYEQTIRPTMENPVVSSLFAGVASFLAKATTIISPLMLTSSEVPVPQLSPALPPGYRYDNGNIITSSGNLTTFNEAWANSPSSNGLISGDSPEKSTPLDEMGAFFFGEDLVNELNRDDATLGKPNFPHFFMPLEDALDVASVGEAAKVSGNAPSITRSYIKRSRGFVVTFPTDRLNVRRPTEEDSGGWPHYLPGGNTAIRTVDPNGGYMINKTREYAIDGGLQMPSGSTMFQIGDDGNWVPVRSW